MSWFRRRPRTKEPLKESPQHFSPMSEKKLKEAKKNGPSKQDNKS